MTKARAADSDPEDADRREAGALAQLRAACGRFVVMNELRLRLASAVILLPVVLVATWLGNTLFLLLVLLCAALVLFEWLRMIGAGGRRPLLVAGCILLAVVALAAETQPPWLAGLAAVAAAAVLALIAWPQRPAFAGRWVLAGGLYTGLAVAAMVALRQGEAGFAAVMFVFLIAWTSDTAAFFVGRKLRGPKLWPSVSPSKTWSGALGGFAAALVAGGLVSAVAGVPLTVMTFVIAALLAIAAQLGDLFESAAKRFFMIKDAGTLIPGHGGLMDRVDGIIAASLIACVVGALNRHDAPAEGLFALMAS